MSENVSYRRLCLRMFLIEECVAVYTLNAMLIHVLLTGYMLYVVCIYTYTRDIS